MTSNGPENLESDASLSKSTEGSGKHSLGTTDDDPVPWVQAVLPVVFTAGMDYFGLGLITPILPFKIAALGASEAWIGWITTAQYLGVLFGGITLGRVADLYSRKLAIQIACAGDIIFFTLTGFCPTVETLLVCRLLAGFFTPLTPSISWVIDSGKGNMKNTTNMMAVWAFSMCMAIMMGNVVGGLLTAERWAIAHSISGGLALLGFVVITIAPSPPRPNATDKPRGVDKILRAPEYVALMASNAVVGCHFTGCMIAAAIILAYQLGLTSFQVSLYYFSMAGSHGIINFVLLPASTKYFGTPIVAMKLILFTSMASCLLLCFDFAYENVLVCCTLLTVCTGTIPIFMTAANIFCSQYADRHTTNARSVVIGMSRFAFNVGQVIGPIVAATSLSYGSNSVFWALSFVLGVTSFFTWLYFHRVAFPLHDDASDKEILGEAGGGRYPSEENKANFDEGTELTKMTVATEMVV
jgi:MFS family permease